MVEFEPRFSTTGPPFPPLYHLWMNQRFKRVQIIGRKFTGLFSLSFTSLSSQMARLCVWRVLDPSLRIFSILFPPAASLLRSWSVSFGGATVPSSRKGSFSVLSVSYFSISFMAGAEGNTIQWAR